MNNGKKILQDKFRYDNSGKQIPFKSLYNALLLQDLKDREQQMKELERRKEREEIEMREMEEFEQKRKRLEEKRKQIDLR